jgi:anti-sigma regulatory factor (Ser/Thr protein kinase)
VEIVLLPLTGELTELARARAWARESCSGTGADQIADIMSVVDELTSNAFRHAVPPYALRLLRSPGYLRIEVDDGSLQLVRARAPSTTGGRGLPW